MPPTIRLARPDDAGQIAAIYAAYFDTPITFELQPPDADEMLRRMAKILEKYPWLVCEEAGEILGYAYASPHRERAAYRWSVDVTVYVHRDRQRRGVGRALYTSLLAALPLQGYVTAHAGVTLPNPASIGLHEAMGFTPVGVYPHVGFKGGAWHDVAWFRRSLQASQAEPAEPRALAEVVGTAGWEDALRAGQKLVRT